MVGTSYNKENVSNMILNYYKKNGKIKIRDLKSSNNLPTSTAVIFLYGSFQNCLKELGIYQDSSAFNRKYKKDTEMLDEMKTFVEEHLKSHLYLPTFQEIDDNKNIASSSCYINRFGSLDNVYKKIGYSVSEFNHKRFLEDIKKKYIYFCNKYNKLLNSRDITLICKTDDMYAVGTIINNFGSLSAFQKECGYCPKNIGRFVTPEDSIVLLQLLAKELSRVPMQEDLPNFDWIPSASYYFNTFGSFTKALQKANLTTPKMHFSNKGVRCNSAYEVKIANSLEKYNINYSKEILYKDVIKDFDRLYRFDFSICIDNIIFYIEYFGIIGVPSYDEKTQEKIKLCKTNNIRLISLYKKDIFGKTYDEIYKIIIAKINEEKR